MTPRIPAIVLTITLLLGGTTLEAQFIPPEELQFLTAEWQGERTADGRPRVPDDILQRMRNVSIEEAWGILRNQGYNNQFAGEWQIIDEDEPIVGRALTAVYLPSRPELAQRITERGQQERGQVGAMNSWPIDALQPGDVYVADGMGKIADGTLIGDNLGNAIYAKSGNGVIFDGSLRDLEGLERIEGFNAFVRGWHPSYIQEMMLGGLNVPVRIGEAVVLPGDVVLAKRTGVLFIPAHLAEEVVERSEIITLRDRFGQQRLREGRYTPGQIDTQWTEPIKKDFIDWTKTKKDLPMTRKELDDYLKNRTW